MMTSRADVMQTGVVIGQAAEKGYVCVCVHMLGQGESMRCPLGVFCSQSEFWMDTRDCVFTGRGKGLRKRSRRRRLMSSRKRRGKNQRKEKHRHVK